MLLRKEDERRTVEVATLARDVVANAIANAFRHRGARELPLFKKVKAVDTSRARRLLAKFEKIERSEA